MNILTVNELKDKGDMISEFSPVVREKIEEERKSGKPQLNMILNKTHHSKVLLIKCTFLSYRITKCSRKIKAANNKQRKMKNMYT